MVRVFCVGAKPNMQDRNCAMQRTGPVNITAKRLLRFSGRYYICSPLVPESKTVTDPYPLEWDSFTVRITMEQKWNGIVPHTF